MENPPIDVPPIDLVILSGDITEWGRKAEFDQARAFVDRLCSQLDLGPDRVVVVPGNHDVNWKLCESYFLEQEANDEEPQHPFAKKWLPYEAFVRGLHGDEAFSADRPYRLQVFADLGIVVAALNSTINETHQDEDHYGWCGEEQLRWFADQLRASSHLVRVGVVHHNVRRKAEADDENLRDEDAFTQVLGPELDLVLHGHTHHGKKDHLSDGTLVLATGSAAVRPEQRPDEVPNPCQILHVGSGATTRWALQYRPDKRQWEGDTSASPDGTRWVEEIPGPQAPERKLLTDLLGADATSSGGRLVRQLPAELIWDHLRRRRSSGGRLGSGDRDVSAARLAEMVTEMTMALSGQGGVAHLDPELVLRARAGPLVEWDISEAVLVALHDRVLKEAVLGSDLLRSAMAVTWLRDEVRSVEFRRKGDVPYLAVFGISGGMWAVGVVDGHLTDTALDDFLEQVHRSIQSRGPGARSEIVHTGPADADLVRRGLRHGVIVKTWAEYQNLLDLSAYEGGLQRELLADELYPQDLYLSQRYRTVDKRGQPDDDILDDLADSVLDDLLLEGPRFVLVLGDPGFGKSFLTRRLTHLLLDGNSGVTPIVILLREAEKRHSVDEMVAGALANTSAYFQSDKFRRMFRGGRIVLLVDGYDEFAVRVGYDRAAEQLRTFLRALDGESKILLTTRPSHFRRKQEVVSQIFEDVLDLDAHQRRVYELEPFDEDQQREFLRRWFGLRGQSDAAATTEADRWMTALGSVDNLPELARTPRMLSFMAAHLSLDQIREAGEEEGPVTAAGLYEMLVEEWLTTETAKFDKPGRRGPATSRPANGGRVLTSQDRWRVAEELAYRLWVTGEPHVSEPMLEDVAGAVLDLPAFGLTAQQAAQEIGSRTLLVGDGDERYFAHQSIAEFLLARKLAQLLRESEAPPELGRAELSELTARFLRDLAPNEGIRWLRALADRAARADRSD